MTKASVFSPAYVPVFDPPPTRGETRVRKQTSGGGLAELPPFGFLGILYTATGDLESLIYPVPTAATVVEIAYTLVVPPTTGSITFEVLVNGTPVAAAAASTTFATSTVSIILAEGDLVQVVVTAAGSGDGAGLNVVLRL